MEVRLKDFGNLRRLKAERACRGILELIDGDVPDIAALLADYDALKRENDVLRHENDKLRWQVEELSKASFLSDGDLLGEEWRDVVGYEGRYQVSNKGRVKSFCQVTPKILSLFEDNWGYLAVGLNKNGVRTGFIVHRLVAEAFIPNPDGKPFVNHIDGNKQNNRVENLEWVTRGENIRHAFLTGLNVGRRKLTDEQVRYVRENPDNLLQRQLGEMFGVAPSTICEIQKGVSYKHVK